MPDQTENCRSGKHEKTPENTGRRGECLECHREYQREYMRRKRHLEQFPEDDDPREDAGFMSKRVGM